MTADVFTNRDEAKWFHSAVVALAVLIAASALVGDPLGSWFVARVIVIEMLLVSLLIRHGMRPVAWLLVYAASFLTLLIIASGAPIPSDPTGYRVRVAMIVAAIAGFYIVGVLYAAEPSRRLGRWVVPVGVALIGWTILGGIAEMVWLANSSSFDDRIAPWWVSLATIPFIGYGAIAMFVPLVAGVVGELRRVAPTIVRRIRREHASWPAWPWLVIDELLPGREAGRQAAARAERLQFAADVHAEVLPALNAVLADSVAGASPDQIAGRLRELEQEVRGLVSERRLVILEEFGIVQALEWLAERVEERSGTIVELLVSAGMEEGRPPREIERGAFRIAQLALDNAILHAKPERVAIDVLVEPVRLRLSVDDDGPGLTPGDRERAAPGNRQGMADMRSQAELLRARFDIVPSQRGGTVVVFDWTAR